VWCGGLRKAPEPLVGTKVWCGGLRKAPEPLVGTKVVWWLQEGDHTLTLSLRISDIDDGDFGEYRCIASNSLGHDDAAMVLYGTISSPATTSGHSNGGELTASPPCCVLVPVLKSS